jgi:hypothetical protein
MPRRKTRQKKKRATSRRKTARRSRVGSGWFGKSAEQIAAEEKASAIQARRDKERARQQVTGISHGFSGTIARPSTQTVNPERQLTEERRIKAEKNARLYSGRNYTGYNAQS